MPSYSVACSTKDYYEDDLCRDYPDIVSIAPRLQIDSEGKTSGNAYIVIGVDSEMKLNDSSIDKIPRTLQCYDSTEEKLLDEECEVEVVYERPPIAQAYTTRVRPCPGGYSVGPVTRNSAGTLGIQFFDGDVTRPGFFVTCNHVAAGTNQGPVGLDILQPGLIDGGAFPGDSIGFLERWVHIHIDRLARNEVDAALVQVHEPWDGNLALEVLGIGRNIGSVSAMVDDRVTKVGRTTELTWGNVLSTDATVIVNYPSRGRARFVHQIQCTFMSRSGDSGSVLFKEVIGKFFPCGLIFAGSEPTDDSEGRTYANSFHKVVTSLNQVKELTDAQGVKTQLEPRSLFLTPFGNKYVLPEISDDEVKVKF